MKPIVLKRAEPIECIIYTIRGDDLMNKEPRYISINVLNFGIFRAVLFSPINKSFVCVFEI